MTWVIVILVTIIVNLCILSPSGTWSGDGDARQRDSPSSSSTWRWLSCSSSSWGRFCGSWLLALRPPATAFVTSAAVFFRPQLGRVRLHLGQSRERTRRNC